MKTTWNHLNVQDRPSLQRGASKLPSMTVPDQSMSMRTIMERYASGHIQPQGQEPLYGTPEDLGVDLRTLDLTERHEILRAAKETITMYRENHEKALRAKQKAELLQEARKELAEQQLKEVKDENEKRLIK